jgi:ribosome biogenesis GTPase
MKAERKTPAAAASVSGRVVESYGRRALIEAAGGLQHKASVFGKRLQIVCGDYVSMRHAAGSDEYQITSIEPRKTMFARTDSRGVTEPLAANLNLLAVLVAPEPESDLFIVDRYLAGAAYAQLRSLLIINKIDVPAFDAGPLAQAASEYRAAGYPVLQVSAATGAGIAELRELLKNDVALFVGQSGVGKTTLTNALVPESLRATRTLSAATGEGRHTTVSAALLKLPGGGELIDSPGVRDYAPPPLSDANVQHGWKEIAALAAQCRFHDCLHVREPGCAVLAAVAAQQIAPRRYESYKRLLNVMRGLAPSYERNR